MHSPVTQTDTFTWQQVVAAIHMSLGIEHTVLNLFLDRFDLKTPLLLLNEGHLTCEPLAGDTGTAVVLINNHGLIVTEPDLPWFKCSDKVTKSTIEAHRLEDNKWLVALHLPSNGARPRKGRHWRGYQCAKQMLLPTDGRWSVVVGAYLHPSPGPRDASRKADDLLGRKLIVLPETMAEPPDWPVLMTVMGYRLYQLP